MTGNRISASGGKTTYLSGLGARAIFLLFCMWLVGLSIQPAAMLAHPQDGIIELSGNVVDDLTGLPVTEFALQWGQSKDLDSEIVWGYGLTTSITPRRDGQFRESRSFTAGRKVSLRILANGYLPQPVTEPLTAAARISGLVVRLKRGGEIRGTVVDHAGMPVASAQVYLTGSQPLDLVDGTPRSFRGSTATTDPAGQFALYGGDPLSSQSILVSFKGGQIVAIAAKPRLGEEANICLPEPAKLIVHYDVPGDDVEAKLGINLATWEMEEWKNARVSTGLQPTIRNQDKLELTVTPGVYDFAREKIVRVENLGRGFACDRRKILLAPGETQIVEIRRHGGYAIEGYVPGLKDSGSAGAYVTVRGADATGNPRNIKELSLIFDALACNPADGHFKTAPLLPGTYTVVIEAYLPELPEQRFSTGIRLPDFIGTAKVEVLRDTALAPVKIDLRPAK